MQEYKRNMVVLFQYSSINKKITKAETIFNEAHQIDDNVFFKKVLIQQEGTLKKTKQLNQFLSILLSYAQYSEFKNFLMMLEFKLNILFCQFSVCLIYYLNQLTKITYLIDTQNKSCSKLISNHLFIKPNQYQVYNIKFEKNDVSNTFHQEALNGEQNKQKVQYFQMKFLHLQLYLIFYIGFTFQKQYGIKFKQILLITYTKLVLNQFDGKFKRTLTHDTILEILERHHLRNLESIKQYWLHKKFLGLDDNKNYGCVWRFLSLYGLKFNSNDFGMFKIILCSMLQFTSGKQQFWALIEKTIPSKDIKKQIEEYFYMQTNQKKE